MANIKPTIGSSIVHEIIKTADATLRPAEMTGTFISNLGQIAETTLTMDTAAKGYNFVGNVITTGNALHYKAGPSDKIYLNGIALDDGDKISLATPTAGDHITFWTFESSAGVWDWMCSPGIGLWIDGGA